MLRCKACSRSHDLVKRRKTAKARLGGLRGATTRIARSIKLLDPGITQDDLLAAVRQTLQTTQTTKLSKKQVVKT